MSRGIALLFLGPWHTRWCWGFSLMPRLPLPPGKTHCKGAWVGPTGLKTCHTGVRSWTVHAIGQSLYRLSYPAHILTPWCRVLLEKLTGLQLVKKFPAFHGTRRFITAPTSVRQLSLSWVSPIQSIYPHSTSWRSVLILSAIYA